MKWNKRGDRNVTHGACTCPQVPEGEDRTDDGVRGVWVNVACRLHGTRTSVLDDGADAQALWRGIPGDG